VQLEYLQLHHSVTSMQPVSGDARRDIIFPDVHQSSVNGCAILADFRCGEIVISEWTVSFDGIEALTHSVIIDLAHREWLIIPLLIARETAIRTGRIARELDFKHFVQPSMK
jgi:hypothetical protein